MIQSWFLKHQAACVVSGVVSPQLKGAHNVDRLYTNNNNIIRPLHPSRLPHLSIKIITLKTVFKERKSSPGEWLSCWTNNRVIIIGR